MDPRNNIPQNGLSFSDEHLDWELDAEMREWDERNGITYEDGEDGELDYEADDGDWMDADALASAGWGTDEDYGYYGGDEW